MKSRLSFFHSLGIVLVLVVGLQTAFAQNLPEPQNPPRLVNDFANILSQEEEDLLEKKLLWYEDSTGSQVAIVLISSLEGYDISDYAARLFNKWKIGTQKDNGLLLIGAMEDRKFRIEVGYGLEPVITDGISKRIINESIKPNFKEGQYYQGLEESINSFFKAARGEFKGENKYTKRKKRKGLGFGSIAFILFVLFVFWLLSKGGHGGRGGGGDFWTGMILGQLLSGGRGRGGWGDFSSGSGDFGGFGGFGGGSSGGGGASGDW